MILIAGPCVIESEDVMISTCEYLASLSKRFGYDFYFKSSYDKGNRTSVKSFRGPGIHKGIEILNNLKERFGVKILTDIHHGDEVEIIKDIVDMIQIPALLCRQTDIIRAAAESGKVLNIKKGQFMSPWDMKNVLEKARYYGAKEMLITERGTTFGYNNLVVDFRAFPIMKKLDARIIFDGTHSVQLPGGLGDSSGGEREYVPYLCRAAAACGIDGVFLEVHPEPDKALCDGPNMIDFKMAESILDDIVKIEESLWT